MDYKIGDMIPKDVVQKILRWESLVHTGMIEAQR